MPWRPTDTEMLKMMHLQKGNAYNTQVWSMPHHRIRPLCSSSAPSVPHRVARLFHLSSKKKKISEEPRQMLHVLRAQLQPLAQCLARRAQTYQRRSMSIIESRL